MVVGLRVCRGSKMVGVVGLCEVGGGGGRGGEGTGGGVVVGMCVGRGEGGRGGERGWWWRVCVWVVGRLCVEKCVGEEGGGGGGTFLTEMH